LRLGSGKNHWEDVEKDMSSARNVKILTWLQFCTVVAIILAARFYIKPQQSVSAAATRGMVDGILYSPDAPSALVDGQVMRVGDLMYGVKVTRIDKAVVAFEKNGKKWQQRVRQRPDPAWDEPDLNNDNAQTASGSTTETVLPLQTTAAPGS